MSQFVFISPSLFSLFPFLVHFLLLSASHLLVYLFSTVSTSPFLFLVTYEMSCPLFTPQAYTCTAFLCLFVLMLCMFLSIASCHSLLRISFTYPYFSVSFLSCSLSLLFPHSPVPTPHSLSLRSPPLILFPSPFMSFYSSHYRLLRLTIFSHSPIYLSPVLIFILFILPFFLLFFFFPSPTCLSSVFLLFLVHLLLVSKYRQKVSD